MPILTNADSNYAVATMSRLLKIIGLLCKRDLQKRLYSAKETHRHYTKFQVMPIAIHPDSNEYDIGLFYTRNRALLHTKNERDSRLVQINSVSKSCRLQFTQISSHADSNYAVATTSRLPKLIGLLCKRAL